MTSDPTSEQRSNAGDGPACSLGPKELEGRLNEWRSLRADALISESVRDRVQTALYKRNEDVARRLRILIEAEASCCPFIEFRLYEETEVIRVEARVLDDAPALFTLGEPAASVGEREGG
jgi:hypothetical protein